MDIHPRAKLGPAASAAPRCSLSRARASRALEELGAALEAKPELEEMAEKDELLAPLRDPEGWPLRG